MPDDPKKQSDQRRSEERKRILGIVSSIYAEGYADGVSQAAVTYHLQDHVPGAGLAMGDKLGIRLDLVDDALNSYRRMVGVKAEKLREAGLDPMQVQVALTDYARNLADSRGDIIAEMEHAQAKLDGAGKVMDEAGVKYLWRFPHFDLGTPHMECPICEEIRRGAPYTQGQAEDEGFPSHPHPGCDHGWVIVPVGEDTLTEQFPPADWWPR